MTIAGDAAQRIDPTGFFASWEQAMKALGVCGTPAWLETSYRSPKPIIELGHAILGTQAPQIMPRAVRDGLPVLYTTVPNEGHAATILCQSLRGMLEREPYAGVAIIARDQTGARALHEVLARGLPVRLVLDGEFSFGPGIEITEVAQVKGLEFDAVVIPDATAKVYPDTAESRRMLHVAVTRAMHRLWLICPGAPARYCRVSGS